MRIVIINSTTDLYGANRILSQSILGFPDYCEIEVWLPSLEGPFPELLATAHGNVKLKAVNVLPIIQRKMFSPKGILELLSLLGKFYNVLKAENEKRGIDLLYVNTLSNFFVLPISKSLRIFTLIHVHEILEKPKLIAVFFSGSAVFFSSRILCVSNAVVAGLKRWSSRRFDNRITCIHNGIADLYCLDSIKKPDNAHICVTLISRIKPEKGIWYFLEALKGMECKNRVAVRIIGGAAPFGENHVDKLLEDIKGMPMAIEYIPFVNDVSSYLNQADILVVPSIAKDSFPTTVLEGMACGKPVVATDMGGAAEAINHLHNGILISNHDVRSFASYLDKLVTDAPLRSELGRNARATFLERFHESIFQKNLSNYFLAILKPE